MTAPSSAGRSHPLRPSYLGRPSGSPRGQYWPLRFIAACDRCGRSPPRYSPPPRLPRTPAARGLRTIGRPSFPHVNSPQPCIPGRFPITASERTPPKLVTRSVPGTSRNRIANQSNAERRGARAVVKRHCRPEKSAPKTTPAKRITRAWFTRPASIHRPICTSSRPPRRPYASRRPCRHERISPTYQDPHWRQEPHAPQARDTRLHPSPPTCTRFTPAPSSPAASPTRYAPMGDPNRLRQPLSAPPNGAQRGTRPSPPPRSPNAIPRIQLAAASAQNVRHVRRPIELFDPDSFNTTPRTPSQERAHGGILNQLR